MKKFSLILALVTSVLLINNSCTKKELNITLKEDGCSKFKIYGATYNTLADPSCSGSPLTASYEITFKYTGEIKCLTVIKLEPQFLTSDNVGIFATYVNEINTEGNSQVTINESAKTCTFRFDFTFNNTTEANSYNHCFLKFHTENSQGESSKDAQVRMAGNCSEMTSGGYNNTPVTTIHVSSSTIQLRLWDDGAEDGDIVSVYLIGQPMPVILNHSLTNAGTTFTIPISSGTNKFVLVAMNQGSVGPNTCALSVNGGATTSLSLDLKTGQSVNVVF